MAFVATRSRIPILLTLVAAVYLTIFAVRASFVERSLPPVLGTAPSPEHPKSYWQIRDKVAVISDTKYTARLVPLILHFHSVLGPEWPIVFYTTKETRDQHLTNHSAVWDRAVRDGRVQLRLIPDEFDLTKRRDVNLFLSRPWLWEQLAPAKHVLVFQADAMICANSYRTIDDFLHWDFIGAVLHTSRKLFNGGLSLRNRSMILDIVREGNWEEETESGAWTMGGEDIWFSQRMEDRGGNLPDGAASLEFSCEHQWHVDRQKHPFGYHKVHKYAGGSLEEISQWCPEIALATPGPLQDGE